MKLDFRVLRTFKTVGVQEDVIGKPATMLKKVVSEELQHRRVWEGNVSTDWTSVRVVDYDADTGKYITNDEGSYRIKQEPKILWVNEYADGRQWVYDNKTDALDDAARRNVIRVAVKYQEVLEES